MYVLRPRKNFFPFLGGGGGGGVEARFSHFVIHVKSRGHAVEVVCT